MINLTNYSDDELSPQVFNDEVLYTINKTQSLDVLLDTVNALFIYTAQQHTVLLNDLAEEEA